MAWRSPRSATSVRTTSAPGAVTNHPARLRGAVELVGQARGGVDLEHAVAVEITQFDFVDEGIGLGVEFLHGVAAVAVAVEHRHDTLVVGDDCDIGVAVSIDIGHLEVAHAAEFSAEVLLPQGLLVALGVPELDHGLAAAGGEDAGLAARQG